MQILHAMHASLFTKRLVRKRASERQSKDTKKPLVGSGCAGLMHLAKCRTITAQRLAFSYRFRRCFRYVFRLWRCGDDLRDALAVEIDLNIPVLRVIRVLDRIVANRGYPLKMRMDNGPELVSLALAQWAEEHGVQLEFISPGKPTQNAFIERFNRTYWTEILDFYLFRTLNEAREITESWLMEYNHERPHESLNNLTPEEYRLMTEKPELSKVRGTKAGILTELTLLVFVRSSELRFARWSEIDFETSMWSRSEVG